MSIITWINIGNRTNLYGVTDRMLYPCPIDECTTDAQCSMLDNNKSKCRIRPTPDECSSRRCFSNSHCPSERPQCFLSNNVCIADCK